MSEGAVPRRPVDAGPLVVAASACVAGWVATAAQPSWLWLCVVGVALAAVAAIRWRQPMALGVAVLSACLLLAGGWRAQTLLTGPVAELAESRAVVVADVRVGGSSRSWPASGIRPPLWRSSGQLLDVEGRGVRWRTSLPVVVIAGGDLVGAWSHVPPGSIVQATVRIESPEPGEPVAAVLRVRAPPDVVGQPGVVDAGVAVVRQGLRSASEPLTPDARALVPALVVGDTAGMPPDLSEIFRTTGLTHLTAVSGANLTLLLVALRAVAVRLGARGRLLTAVLVLGVAGFVAVCLGEPSVVRAAAMGLVGLAALGRAGRGRHGIRFLATAVLVVVLIDPWMTRSVGFWLSVLATFGLLAWAGSWADRLATWLPRWAAEALAVALAAQVVTQPVVTALSGQVSVVGILANVAAAPLVGPATVVGVVTAVIAPWALPAAQLIVWPAGWCAQSIAWLARMGVLLPGAAWMWPPGAATLAVVTAASVFAIIALPHMLSRPVICVPITGLMLVILALPPPVPGWPPRSWSVVACDVGQGDAIVLNAGRGSAVVVDAGPEPRALDACLTRLGVTHVPLAVFTHLHADHVSGAPALAARRLEVAVTSGVRTPHSGDRIVEGLAVRRHVASEGEVWRVGEVHLTVLASDGSGGGSTALEAVTGVGATMGGTGVGATKAGTGVGATKQTEDDVGPGADGDSAAENDASLLVRAEVGDVSILLAGDAETSAQEQHATLGHDIDVDVLIVPHHGSPRHSASFFAATTPVIALISVGADNTYGHPAASTLASLTRAGAVTARTDLQGSVAVARDPGGGLVLTRERSPG